MSKQHRRNLLIVVSVGLTVNTVVASLGNSPGLATDAAYYTTNGLLLAEDGWRFQEPFIWNYLNPPDVLPHPPFGYWQPMPSVITALSVLLFGRSFTGAQVLFVLMAALLPVLTYLISLRLGPPENKAKRALVAGLLISLAGFFAITWSMPETFTPYALFAGGGLYVLALATEKQQRWLWLTVGVLFGLAYLTRSDGALLLPMAGLFALSLMRSRSLLDGVIASTLLTVGFFIVAGPWFVRNIRIYGAPQPPGGLSTIFLIEYADLARYPSSPATKTFFAQPVGVILWGRLQAMYTVLHIFASANNFVILAPFTVLGIRDHWRDMTLRPALTYGGILFFISTIVFTYPGIQGTWMHSSSALMPFIVSIAVVGLEDLVRTVKPKEYWGPQRAFTTLSIVLLIAATGAVVEAGWRNFPRWNTDQRAFSRVAQALDDRDVPIDTVVMSANPPLMYYYSGRYAIPTVLREKDELLAAAEHYGVQYVFAERLVNETYDVFQNQPLDTACFSLLESYEDGLWTLYEVTC